MVNNSKTKFGGQTRDLHVVTVLVGDKYGDVYLDRLYNMVRRNSSSPIRFTAFTDRNRNVNSSIEQIDCSNWNLRGWFNKVRLFDLEVLSEPFLYLDVTQIVKSPLTPLLQNFDNLNRDLCVRIDFRYPDINSCVMAIQPNEATNGIWKAFLDKMHPEDLEQGDQTFIFRTLVRLELMNRVGFIEPKLIASYRRLRRLSLDDPVSAKRALDEAVILKFHGNPRMPETQRAFVAWLAALPQCTRSPLKFASYLRKEIREWWV